MLLASVGFVAASSAQDRNAMQAEAINAIKRLGGQVQRDYQAPGQPVIGVGFSGTDVTDDDLAILKNLPSLETLILSRTDISDAGLKHLKGLTSLRQLNLPARTTDHGLKHLERLAKLQTLYLIDTQISDAGLKYLKGLQSLRVVLLNGTRVTADGARDLQRALPRARIGR